MGVPPASGSIFIETRPLFLWSGSALNEYPVPICDQLSGIFVLSEIFSKPMLSSAGAVGDCAAAASVRKTVSSRVGTILFITFTIKDERCFRGILSYLDPDAKAYVDTVSANDWLPYFW